MEEKRRELIFKVAYAKRPERIRVVKPHPVMAEMQAGERRGDTPFPGKKTGTAWCEHRYNSVDRVSQALVGWCKRWQRVISTWVRIELPNQLIEGVRRISPAFRGGRRDRGFADLLGRSPTAPCSAVEVVGSRDFFPKTLPKQKGHLGGWP